MRPDYTLIATPRPPSLAPLVPPTTTPSPAPAPRPRFRALREWAAIFATISACFGLPVFVAVQLGVSVTLGFAVWAASVPLAWVLVRTAPPSEYRPVLPRRSSSQEPGGLGAYYAYQDWASGGDCGGDGGAC